MEHKVFTTALYPVADETKPKKRGQLWCCFCGEYRTFKPKQSEGYPRCSDCNISVYEFDIRNANHTWHNSL